MKRRNQTKLMVGLDFGGLLNLLKRPYQALSFGENYFRSSRRFLYFALQLRMAVGRRGLRGQSAASRVATEEL